MMDWRPIETIPDGELVLAFSPGWGIDFCRKVDGVFYVDGGPIFSQFPTHWMPLPQPPET